MKLDADQPIAEAAPSRVHFDFSKLSPRDRYKLLIGTVIPRPIAFITTVDEHGVVNAAPFSFFNCLSHPTIVAIGVENHPDMRHKDTDPMWLA
jgi:flavin reductase (DIM6/NTAB) family NADH-FMN oxidoreductase RutF